MGSQLICPPRIPEGGNSSHTLRSFLGGSHVAAELLGALKFCLTPVLPCAPISIVATSVVRLLTVVLKGAEVRSTNSTTERGLLLKGSSIVSSNFGALRPAMKNEPPTLLPWLLLPQFSLFRFCIQALAPKVIWSCLFQSMDIGDDLPNLFIGQDAFPGNHRCSVLSRGNAPE